MTEKPLLIDSLLIEAIRAIENTHRRIAVVVAQGGILLGTLTDGDVRRCLLAGGTVQTPVVMAMNKNPIRALEGSAPGYLLDIMVRNNIMAVPLVDNEGRFLRLLRKTEVEQDSAVEKHGTANFDFAVIMAGGEGRRLWPLTENTPKPMVEVCGVSLLERQIRRLAQVGVARVYLSVNYLSNMIEAYFGDGSSLGVDIRYLREEQKLGTGGALALLPETPTRPIVVMNGDILTQCDFESLYVYHTQHGAVITAAAIQYDVNIPFGVLQNEGAYATQLVEKPSQRFLCNAGIYALEPSALDLAPKAGPFNMTDLIEQSLATGKKVAVFPVHEYWSDIGTPADLDKARTLFEESA